MEFIKSVEEYRFNPRTFLRICKSIKNCFKIQITIVKDNNGHLLSEKISIVNRFKSYFFSLLSIVKEEYNADEKSSQSTIRCKHKYYYSYLTFKK